MTILARVFKNKHHQHLINSDEINMGKQLVLKVNDLEAQNQAMVSKLDELWESINQLKEDVNCL